MRLPEVEWHLLNRLSLRERMWFWFWQGRRVQACKVHSAQVLFIECACPRSFTFDRFHLESSNKTNVRWSTAVISSWKFLTIWFRWFRTKSREIFRKAIIPLQLLDSSVMLIRGQYLSGYVKCYVTWIKICFREKYPWASPYSDLCFRESIGHRASDIIIRTRNTKKYW